MRNLPAQQKYMYYDYFADFNFLLAGFVKRAVKLLNFYINWNLNYTVVLYPLSQFVFLQELKYFIFNCNKL